MSQQNELLLPFDVPKHDLMAFRRPGKFGDTVLTIEAQIYNAVIREYTDSLFWESQWCYSSEIEAFAALAIYLANPEQEEPAGWVRAIGAGRAIRYPSP